MIKFCIAISILMLSWVGSLTAMVVVLTFADRLIDRWDERERAALDAARTESKPPATDMHQERGIWRCGACGVALPESCMGLDWRWAGDRWQHKHDQAGYIDAQYFARTESDKGEGA